MNPLEQLVRAAKATKKSRRKKPPFDRAAAMHYAMAAFEAPPRSKLTVRPQQKGRIVAQFIVPKELCLTFNRRKNLHWSAVSKLKERILGQLQVQARRLFMPTLSGRPQVLVVRFTARRPDSGAGWDKDVIDALLVPKVVARKGGLKQRKGIGLLEDDSDAHIERHVWWEPGPRAGFVYVEVRTG